LKVSRGGLFFKKLRVLRHRGKIMSKKKMIWIAVPILIALLAAGGLMAWAEPPGNKDGAEQPAAEPAGANPSGAVVPVSVPASIPRAVQRNSMDGELIGTAVVEGGISYAVFQSGSRTRLVREGDEISSGVLLVQVKRNRIDVERNGVREEMRIGSSQGAGQQVRFGSNPAGSGREARARLRDHLRATGRL
jgi:flagellar basal body-associated protein FliL